MKSKENCFASKELITYGYEDEKDHHIARSLGFMQDHTKDARWAHPVDGRAYRDMTAR